MTIQLYEPVPRECPNLFAPPAARLEGLHGKRVALLSNGKPMATEILHTVGDELTRRGAIVSYPVKGYSSRPAGAAFLETIARSADAAIGALGD